MDISVEILEGNPIKAVAHTEYGDVEVISETVPEKSSGKPIEEASVIERMSKLGGTQFYAGKVNACVGEGLYISASALNGLRRAVCEAMTEKVIESSTPRYKVNDADIPAVSEPCKGKPLNFRAEVYSSAQLKEALKCDFELIYSPMVLLDNSIECKDRIVVTPPVVLNNCEDEVGERLERLKSLGYTKGLAHTLAHTRLLKELGFEIHGGYRMNILNSMSADACAEYGFSDVTLSFEGTNDSLSRIRSAIPKGILAYGKIPLMLMRRCPIANGKPCGKKTPFGEGESCGGSVRDRRGNELPVLCNGNAVELLNPDVLILSDRQNVLQSYDFCILKFTTEQASEIEPVLNMYKTNGKPKDKLTRGLYFRGAE